MRTRWKVLHSAPMVDESLRPPVTARHESGKAIAALAGRRRGLSEAGFSPDGGRIVTPLDDQTARVWEVETGREIAVLAGGADIDSVSFSPDGGRVLTVGTYDGTARIWSAETAKPSPIHKENAHDWAIAVSRGHGGVVWRAAFSPDGLLVVTSAGHDARIWDTQTSKEILALSGHRGSVYSAAFSTDGRRVVTASEDKTARIWDAETGQSIRILAG